MISRLERANGPANDWSIRQARTSTSEAAIGRAARQHRLSGQGPHALA